MTLLNIDVHYWGISLILLLIFIIFKLKTQNASLKVENLRILSNNNELKTKLELKYTFQQLMEFLLYIIDFKIKNYIALTIESECIKNDSDFLTDRTFSVHIEECSLSIFTSISSQYYFLICTYFTYDGLCNFIAEKVYVEIFNYYLRVNSSFLNTSHAKEQTGISKIKNNLQEKVKAMSTSSSE